MCSKFAGQISPPRLLFKACCNFSGVQMRPCSLTISDGASPADVPSHRSCSHNQKERTLCALVHCGVFAALSRYVLCVFVV